MDPLSEFFEDVPTEPTVTTPPVPAATIPAAKTTAPAVANDPLSESFEDVPNPTPTVVEAPQKTVAEVTEDYKNKVADAAAEDGEVNIILNDVKSLERYSYAQIYARAEKPDDVGKWLSDSLAGRTNGDELDNVLNDKQNDIIFSDTYEDGDMLYIDGVFVPKGMEKVTIHSSKWASGAQSVLSGMTLNLYDDIVAATTTGSAEESEAYLTKFNKTRDQLWGTDPALAFILEGVGAVGTSVLAAPVSMGGRGLLLGGAALKAGTTAAAKTGFKAGVADLAKISALGAAENVVAGIGERQENKFGIDNIINDAETGAFFGAGIAGGLKIAPKVVEAGRQVLDGLFGSAVAKITGASADNLASAMRDAAKAAGISKADLHLIHQQSLAENTPLSIGTLIKIVAKDPEKLNIFNEVMRDYAVRSGDMSVFDIMHADAANISTHIGGELYATAKTISGGDGDKAIETALKEIQIRIDKGIATAENFKTEADKIINMLRPEYRRTFNDLLVKDPDLFDNPKKFQETMTYFRNKSVAAGNDIEKIRGQIDAGAELSSLDPVLDPFRPRRTDIDGPIEPGAAFDVKRLEVALNESPVLAKSPWRVNIAEETTTAGGKSELRSLPIGGEPVNAFMVKVANTNPELAAKYGVKLDASGNFGPFKQLIIKGEDYEAFKAVGDVDDLLRRPLGDKANIVVAPPKITGLEIGNALEGIKPDLKVGSLNTVPKNEQDVAKSVNDWLKEKHPDLEAKNLEYQQYRKGVILAGGLDDAGIAGDLNKLLVAEAPTPTQLNDLSRTSPEMIPLILDKALRPENIAYILNENDTKSIIMMRRLGDIRKVVDPSFNTDEFITEMMTIRKNITNLETAREQTLKALGAEGLQGAVKRLIDLTDSIGKRDMSGGNVTVALDAIRTEFKARLETQETFITNVTNTSMKSAQITAVTEQLKQLTKDSAVALDNMIANVGESAMLKSLSGVNLNDPGNSIEDITKPLRALLKSTDGRELMRGGIEARLGRKITDPAELATHVNKEIETLDIISKLADSLDNMRKSATVSQKDLRSTSIFMDAFIKTGRTKGSSPKFMDASMYFALEVLRTMIKKNDAGNTRINSRESRMLVDAMYNPNPTDPVVKRAIKKFFGQKPDTRSWIEWVTGKESRLASLELAMVLSGPSETRQTDQESATVP